MNNILRARIDFAAFHLLIVFLLPKKNSEITVKGISFSLFLSIYNSLSLYLALSLSVFLGSKEKKSILALHD